MCVFTIGMLEKVDQVFVMFRRQHRKKNPNRRSAKEKVDPSNQIHESGVYVIITYSLIIISLHRWDKVGLVGAKLDPPPECQTRPTVL